MTLYEITENITEEPEEAVTIKEASKRLNRTVGSLYGAAAEGRLINGRYYLRAADRTLSRNKDRNLQNWRNCGMDKDTLQKAKELERDVKSITRILEEHDKHHWVQVVSPKTDDGQSKRFQNDLAEWLRQQKEIYEKELADL